jgi:Fe-S cluster assembly protein SufB
MTAGFLDVMGSDYDVKYGFHDEIKPVAQTGKGLSEEVVRKISRIKNEPKWLLDFRLRALKVFLSKPMPAWGGDLSQLIFNSITYYIKSAERASSSWDEVPAGIKKTFDRLGIPEAERKFLGGVGAQYESEVVYHSLRKELEKQGVIFVDPDTGFKEHEDIFRKFFGTVVPIGDNKFAALNSAVFSGGSFIYVPPGVKVGVPLQAYFRINAQSMGQFERTLIIADKGSSVNYIEGCLPFDEEILAGDKLVNIMDVKENDIVLNSEGVKTTVAKTMVRPYDGDIVEITPVSTGNRFALTPEHPVLAIRRGSVIVGRRKNRKLSDISPQKLEKAKPEFVEAGELKDGDMLIYPVNEVSHDDKNITDDMLIFLGYYLAEGYAAKINNCDAVVLTFSEKERKTIDHAKVSCNKIINKTPSEFHDKKKHAITLTVYSSRLMNLCLDHCGKGAENKKLSKTIMELPPARQKLLLDAYYKGDGSISYGKPIRVRALTVSKQLAFQLQGLLARQDVYACINIRQPYDEKMRDGRIIHHKQKYTIFYALGRRSINVKLVNGSFIVPIRKVSRKPYAGMVYNFHVSNEPNTYLVKGFAVHNCTAPIYSTDSLHSAVVELVALEGAKIRYTTIQNWSNNVYNLVTKRAHAHKDAIVEWIDANIGSKLTMKYPSVYMIGPGARADILSVAFAGRGQHQDAGAKAVHMAPNTKSTIVSKSISKDGGRTSYRGLVHVKKGSTGCQSSVRCDALLLDEKSRSDTYPSMEMDEDDVLMTHEAKVGKVGEDQIFYLMSRGLKESEALALIVLGFMEQFTKELPMEYAVELNRLIQFEMEGSVG